MYSFMLLRQSDYACSKFFGLSSEVSQFKLGEAAEYKDATVCAFLSDR
jgi:hypothetical protein